MKVETRSIETMQLRMARIALLAAEAATDSPELGAWARRQASAARAACGDQPSCHAPTPGQLGRAVALAARRDVAYVDERPETLVAPGVLLRLGAGDCDDSTALVLAAMLRLGVPPDALAVVAGFDERAPLWHVWPAVYDPAEGIVHCDASTHLTEPGGASPADVAGLEHVMTYPLPSPDQARQARASGLEEAAQEGLVQGATGLLEDMWGELESAVEGMLSPKTTRYDAQRKLFRVRIAQWLGLAEGLAEAIPTAQGQEAETYYASAEAYLDAAEALTRNPTFKARLGDAYSVPPSPGALSPPDGGVSAVQLATHIRVGRQELLRAALKKMGAPGILEGTVPKGPIAIPSPPPSGQKVGADGSPPGGGGGLGVLPILGLGLAALSFFGAGALVPVGAAFVGVPWAGSGRRRRYRAAAAAPELIIPPRAFLSGPLGYALTGGSADDPAPAALQGVDEATKAALAYLALFPDGSPATIRDDEVQRTVKRLQGFADLGLMTLGELTTLLGLSQRIPQWLRRLAGFNLSPPEELAVARELEWAGVSARSFLATIEGRVAQWVTTTGLEDQPEEVVQAQLEDLSQPLSAETQAALEAAKDAARGPGFGAGLGTGMALALAAAIAILFFARR